MSEPAPMAWPLQGEHAHLWLADRALVTDPALHWAAMGEDDLDAVLRIEQDAHSHPWTRRHFQDARASGDLMQLLCAGHVPVGYFIAMPGVDEVHLLDITVAPAWQGRGLGRCLLHALTQWAEQLGKSQVWLEVRRSNVQAIGAYLRFGFEQVGVRKGYYPDTPTTREDAIVMTLNLPRSSDGVIRRPSDEAKPCP